MPGIASLPPELFESILGLLSDGYSSWNLYACSLVSRVWRLPAQAALNDTVLLEDSDRARAWLDSPSRSTFTTRHLILDSENDWFESVDKELVEACPALESFKASFQGDIAQTMCERITSPSFSSLTLMYPNHFFTDLNNPLPHCLTSLTLHKSGYVSPSLLSLLLSPSTTSLRTFHLAQFSNEQQSPPPLVNYFESTSFPNVKSLILDNAGDYEHWPALLSSFPNLVHLEVRNWMKASIVAVGVAAVGCPRVQTVEFSEHGFVNEASLGELVKVLERGGMEGLREVRMPKAQREVFHGVNGRKVLEACEERGIVMYCRAGRSDMLSDILEATLPHMTSLQIND